jgi:hypothetical protein
MNATRHGETENRSEQTHTLRFLLMFCWAMDAENRENDGASAAGEASASSLEGRPAEAAVDRPSWRGENFEGKLQGKESQFLSFQKRVGTFERTP